jgi:hypothetical protein
MDVAASVDVIIFLFNQNQLLLNGCACTFLQVYLQWKGVLKFPSVMGYEDGTDYILEGTRKNIMCE